MREGQKVTHTILHNIPKPMPNLGMNFPFFFPFQPSRLCVPKTGTKTKLISRELRCGSLIPVPLNSQEGSEIIIQGREERV
jgi:hypothetical protein